MSWLVLTSVIAHVGGIPTQAQFEKPIALGELDDATATITWRDNEQDLTGLFDFYYQASNVRPSVMVGHPDFAGTLFAEGVAISDPANMLDWDTSGIGSGTYYVYEITRDPPLNPVFSVTPAPITVQHAGDPRWPAVIVDEPDGIGDTQPSKFAIKWRATGEGALTAAIRYAEVGNDTLMPVTNEVGMAEDAGIYEGCYLWNISLLPQGTYYVQVEVSDEAGHRHASYSRNVLVVYRNPDAPDGGVEPSCEGIGPPDAGPSANGDGGGGDDDAGKGCLCRIGGHRGRAPWLSAFACVATVAMLRRRRRRG